jgi:periplasmic divalent cation tolerance protein
MRNFSTDLIVVYCSFPNATDAVKIARLLVERKLVACCNVIPNITSIYEWNGTVKQESEVIMLAKTTIYNFEKIREFIVQNHTYSTPTIYSYKIDECDEKFADWVFASLNSFVLQ